MEKKGKMRKPALLLCVFLAIIFVFSLLAGQVHSSFGVVKIWDIRYATEEGGFQRALLYVPKSATAENPAPAIVACHGYNNTAEVQDINAIELSRRGYVVISIDAYRHGLSSEADSGQAEPAGGGTYAALQYLGTLPYVDAENIGMVGHSMGGMNIQAGAAVAFARQEQNPEIVVPKSVVPTASFIIPGEDGLPILSKYPVNYAIVNAVYEEFVSAIMPDGRGDELNQTQSITDTFGFALPEYHQLYEYGNPTPLSREEAVAAAERLQLREVTMTPVTHPGIHFSQRAVRDIVDFFDISLRGGAAPIAATNQVWMWKHIFSGIAMLAFILLAIPLGGVLLQTRFFATIIKPEPESYAVVQGGKGAVRYVLLFLVCAVPSALLYFICMLLGNLMISNFFPLANVNGVLILNLLSGLISLLFFFVFYKTMYKKNGATMDNMGVKLPVKQIFKTLLLAAVLFFASYFTLLFVDYFFKVDFRFWVFSFRTITPVKWGIWLRYIPIYLFFFAVTGLTLNMTTRIKGKSEVVNTLLIFVSSMFGLLVLCLLDYLTFFATGYKLFPTVLGISTGLFGILLWGIIFILPLAALITRYFFKKTGTIWLGAFTNAFIVTLFAISNTVVTVGPLY